MAKVKKEVVLKILQKYEGRKVGIFIDDANIYHLKKKVGWKVNWKKFIKFLSKYFKITLTNYYMVIPDKNDTSYKDSLYFKRKIKRQGLTVVDKRLKYIKDKHGRLLTKKGNVDIEITLGVVENLSKLDFVFLISGDSDFIALRDFLNKRQKRIIYCGYKGYMGWELMRTTHIFLEELREFIQ